MRGNAPVLFRVSLAIREGEHVAILGPNGSGKSTLVKTITRELYPVLDGAGDVTFRFQGREVWDVFALRSSLGVVSPDLQLQYTRGVCGRDVVISGFFSSIGLFHHHVTPDMEERAENIMRFLGIDRLAGRPMDTLSTGEARRFLIARALVHGPRTLILDEPTNSLDLAALHAFRSVIRDIARSGVGIIMVTHSLHDIIPEISRVILMKEGRIRMDGRKEDVLTDRHLQDLFGVPVTVRQENGYYYASGY
ncbi:MAG TPA: ATP-binding cassette domain-containing protein [Methanolinea sp.]|mgnify:CR=1 FL=1|nr:ATP-binding cassette domain-containing protein [Methanolinea sp.]HQE86531.1 ATP-binding cassette domain-containing protein [Methanolinea sp.]